jgi:hypothetical protein
VRTRTNGAAPFRLPELIIRRRKPADTSNIGRVFAYFRSVTAKVRDPKTLELAPCDPAFFYAPLSRAIQKRRFLTQAGITRSRHLRPEQGLDLRMTRTELVKRLADHATKPIADLGSNEFEGGMHQPVESEPNRTAPNTAPRPSGDLFVWFEDTAARRDQGRRGIAGLPESLLPFDYKMRVIERRYAEGHLHLLSAVRLQCTERQGERIAAIYTAALSVGTVAWIGTGRQYEQAWKEMFPQGADNASTPDASCETP